jgi:hypothetical protein
MLQAVLSLLLACEPEQGFFEGGGYVRFLHRRSFQKTFAEALVLLFVCADTLAGSDPCRSGSVIGASLAASMAPMTQSGGDGRWKHRAQACFLLALLYSRAPCWRELQGWGGAKAVVRFRGMGRSCTRGRRGLWLSG